MKSLGTTERGKNHVSNPAQNEKKEKSQITPGGSRPQRAKQELSTEKCFQ